MTPWRTAPILREQKERENGAEDHHETTGAAIIVEISPKVQPSFVGTLKRLFREAMRSLTCGAPVPKPKPQRRRKTEDTGRAFKLVARKIFRRILRMPVIDLYTPELWQWNSPDSAYQAAEEFHYADPNHLSPEP